MAVVRVVLADDNPVSRRGIREILSSNSCLDLIGEAIDSSQALILAKSLQPSVFLMNVNMPGMGGDSGSPVYRPETNSMASVTGVVHSRASGATCMNGWDTSASKWHNIRDYWSLTLITGDAYLPLILK